MNTTELNQTSDKLDLLGQQITKLEDLVIKERKLCNYYYAIALGRVVSDMRQVHNKILNESEMMVGIA